MLAVRHFQQQTIHLSERSLINDPPDIQDISSLTISIPEDTLGEFREMLAEFRKTVLRKVMRSPGTKQGIPLNLQFIPVALLDDIDKEDLADEK